MPPTPNGVNEKLDELLTMFGALATVVGTISTAVANIDTNIDTYVTNALEALDVIAGATQDTAAALGTAAGGAETTVAGLLAIIQGNTSCAPLACAPGADDVDGCVDPFVSIGQIESVDYPGRVFAQWLMVDLAPGLSTGSFLAHTIDNVELVHEATIGWKIYVQSTGAGSASFNPDSGVTIPTNQWVTIDEHQDMAFNVPVGASITVYLCNPTPLPFTECADIISGPASYTSSTNGVNDGTDRDLQVIDWSSIPALTCSDALSYNDGDDHDITFFSSCKFLEGDFSGGYSIHWVSGADPVLVSYVLSGTTPGNHTITAASPNFTIPELTTNIFVTNANADAPDTHPFTISFCPPGA